MRHIDDDADEAADGANTRPRYLHANGALKQPPCQHSGRRSDPKSATV